MQHRGQLVNLGSLVQKKSTQFHKENVMYFIILIKDLLFRNVTSHNV